MITLYDVIFINHLIFMTKIYYSPALTTGIEIAHYPFAMKEIQRTFFSNCSKMRKIKTIIDEIAKTDVSILIKGESGTGKKLVAEAIHLNSHRREKPYPHPRTAPWPSGCPLLFHRGS